MFGGDQEGGEEFNGLLFRMRMTGPSSFMKGEQQTIAADKRD
jgi:hypothetical protein